MSWLQKLYETYEACKSSNPSDPESMMPIGHTTQQAHVQVVIDAAGNFRRASILDKGAATLIPCTEGSGGRSGKEPASHPLCDKLQYLAGDFVKFGGEVTSGFAKTPGEPHRAYLKLLSSWAESNHAHAKLDAVRRYVKRGQIVEDLVRFKVLPLGADSKLLNIARNEMPRDQKQWPPIYKVLAPNQRPQDAFIRWVIEGEDDASGTWQDVSLIESWIAFYATTQKKRGYCMVHGQEGAILALQHPAKLRNDADKAKLISANDNNGYTFRGRFIDADEAASVGFEVTQKAHNALRWLIKRQGYCSGDQAIVSWAVSGAPVPKLGADSYELYQSLGLSADQMPENTGTSNAGQAFALRLKKAIQGYQTKLDPTEDVIVMAMDSATTGRMAITYYRELQSSDFLQRVEAWHSKCAWPQNFLKESQFISTPSLRDIARAAYGFRLDKKLDKAARERLLPCIVDGERIPQDLVFNAARRVINRAAFKAIDRRESRENWENCLGIACGLFRGFYAERKYRMELEDERTTRDYLYGQLFAIAEDIEAIALRVAGEPRDTNAARLMQRFADRPFSTWRTIELALWPYQSRLRTKRGSILYKREQLLDSIFNKFAPSDFTSDAPLSAEFLLAYHLLRRELRTSGAKSGAADVLPDEDSTA